MKKITALSFIVFALTLLLPHLAAAQFEIPKKPDFQTSLYDYAKILSAEEKTSLEQKLVRYSDSTSTQIVVITVPTINGENIGLLTPKWAQEWGIAQAKEDNGVLVLLAEKEREIWISPGYGVEDRLTAGEVGEMTREVIIPEFKAGSYYNGLDKGTDAIFKMLQGKYKSTRKETKSDDGGGFGIILFIIIFIIIIIAAAFGKGKGGGGGNYRGGGGGGSDIGSSILTGLILGSLGRSSGGGFGGGSSSGGFGGGGFGGGFGGGGFSGGGSGGSW